MIRKIKKFLCKFEYFNQKFCEHEYGEYTKNDGGFMCISGETIYIVCKKCGKVRGSYFREYEGRGYK